jgi:hypothetical protein
MHVVARKIQGIVPIDFANYLIILPLLDQWKESADCLDQVEGAQEESFKPCRFTVQVEVEWHADARTREYQNGRGK